MNSRFDFTNVYDEYGQVFLFPTMYVLHEETETEVAVSICSAFFIWEFSFNMRY